VAEKLLTAAQMAGITGQEHPLTDADVRLAVERTYSPWQAALVLRGPRTAWGREHTRPADKGGAGWRDGTWLNHACAREGIHAHLIRGEQHRAGLIHWHTAEQLIRDAATPETAAALQAAVDAHAAFIRRPGTPREPYDAAEGGRLLHAELAAWHALIGGETGEPEQLSLFGEVA
jgi:hypothetical protein